MASPSMGLLDKIEQKSDADFTNIYSIRLDEALLNLLRELI